VHEVGGTNVRAGGVGFDVLGLPRLGSSSSASSGEDPNTIYKVDTRSRFFASFTLSLSGIKEGGAENANSKAKGH